MNVLDNVEKAFILRNALRYIKKRSNGRPTWEAVANICGVGSHQAYAICLEIGVDPTATRFQECNLSVSQPALD